MPAPGKAVKFAPAFVICVPMRPIVAAKMAMPTPASMTSMFDASELGSTFLRGRTSCFWRKSSRPPLSGGLARGRRRKFRLGSSPHRSAGLAAKPRVPRASSVPRTNRERGGVAEASRSRLLRSLPVRLVAVDEAEEPHHRALCLGLEEEHVRGGDVDPPDPPHGRARGSGVHSRIEDLLDLAPHRPAERLVLRAKLAGVLPLDEAGALPPAVPRGLPPRAAGRTRCALSRPRSRKAAVPACSAGSNGHPASPGAGSSARAHSRWGKSSTRSSSSRRRSTHAKRSAPSSRTQSCRRWRRGPGCANAARTRHKLVMR